jgi:hypothetical protein
MPSAIKAARAIAVLMDSGLFNEASRVFQSEVKRLDLPRWQQVSFMDLIVIEQEKISKMMQDLQG